MSTNQEPSTARPLVFLADDDDEFRHLLSDALRNAGYRVSSAGSGRQILELLTAASRGEIGAPDAIVMDVRMPGGSGIDVLHALRVASWNQPIVLVSGFGDPELHSLATELGASVVLDKPFDLEDILGVLEVLLLFSRGEEPEDELEPEPPTLRCPKLGASPSSPP